MLSKIGIRLSRCSLIVVLSLFFVLFSGVSSRFVLALYAQDEPVPDPLAARHCIGLSGLDDDPETPFALDPDSPEFCGCTWGNIYYRGQIIDTVDLVSLSFNTLTEIGTTHVPTGTADVESPFYNVTGAKLGAVRNDVMTLTVEFDGQRLERSFRALPEDGEQQISFVLPEYGAWRSTLSGNYNNAIAMGGNADDNNTLYAGGEDGLLAAELVTKETRELLLPWPSQFVGRIATGSAGELWASSSTNRLALFDGSSWTPVDVPFAGTIRALHVHTKDSKLWVGIDDNTSGTVATYEDGTWETVATFANAPVTTLTQAQDTDGTMWAGTWGDGVYRQGTGDTWVNYSVNEGLASRYVLSAAASNSEDDDAPIWFGTDPTGSSGTVSLGGLSTFMLDGQHLKSYGIESGLPADGTHTMSPAQIKSIAVENEGKAWILANDTLYWLHVPSGRWIAHTTEVGARKLLLHESNILLASADSVMVFDRSDESIAGSKPVITNIFAPNGSTFVRGVDLVVLQASAADTDALDNEPSADESIVVWKWQSSIDGPLCTTADSCSIPAQRLTSGSHEISLLVQDDEGEWSDAATTDIFISGEQLPDTPSPFSLFLPTIQQ